MRREGREKRCPVCLVHKDNCYCDKISKLPLKTNVAIVAFKKERFLPSNTAMLSIRSLENSKLFFRGYQDSPMPEDFILDDHEKIVLYPSDDSVDLNADFLKTINKPIQLIVPDGTWRQAKKIQRREPALAELTCVKIPTNQKSIYSLRRQKFDYGLCTHEAIAYALGIIEGERVQDLLLGNLKTMLTAHETYRKIYEKNELASRNEGQR